MTRQFIRIALALVFLLPAASRAGEDALPDGFKGFSGRLRGTVVSVRDDGRGFALKVSALVKVWKNNRAEEPWCIVGRTVDVLAQWTKGDGDSWHPVERHVRFINTLDEGESLAIEVVQDEGERLHILELTKAQREQAEGGREKRDEGAAGRIEPSLPAGFAGFSGVLEGKVLENLGGGFGFLLRVEGVGKAWKNSAAENPKEAKDKILLVQPRWERRDDGSLRPVPRHVRFLRTLKERSVVRVEVRNRPGEVGVHILELSEDQREAAGDDE